MTNNEIEIEVGRKKILSDDNTLSGNFIYLSGINDFNNSDENNIIIKKNNFVFFKEMPFGIIIRLPKFSPAKEIGINYHKIESIELRKFERYSILNIVLKSSNIYFGIENKSIFEINEFMKSIKTIKYVENGNSEIPSLLIKNLENYFIKYTDLIPINTENIKASRTKRIINFLIDSIFISLLNILFFDNYNLTILILFIIYYTIFEGIFKVTIGKILTKTKVVSTDGTKTDLIFIRTLLRLIPFEPFSYFIGNTGWHDKLSNTVVIDLDLRKKQLIY